MTWNDQIASRRRGISGRFMSLSKRWAGFTSNKGAASGLSGAPNASGGNYDSNHGFYPPETPEATMRQLGDYAFMLRDWRLAHSTYDFLRIDFNHDKAWSYYAAASEMVAITSLLMPHTYKSKYNLEAIDQMLDAAAYSYLTRCSMPFSVARCLTLAIELLQDRGSIAADDAARWGGRLLECGAMEPISQALMSERIADCYKSRAFSTVPLAGGRRRQAAMWNLLSAKCWMKLDSPNQARLRFGEASILYQLEDEQSIDPPFPSMQAYWENLNLSLRVTDLDSLKSLVETGFDGANVEINSLEETEHLDTPSRPVMSDALYTGGFVPQDAGPLNPHLFERNDGFT